MFANTQSKEVKELVLRIEILIFQSNDDKLSQNEKETLLLEMESCLNNLTKLNKQVRKRLTF
jgi:phage terminase Nu1 subunit (DNA packaging protein)